MCARGQHERTRQTEVREQHLAEVGVDLFLVFKGGQLHVAQAESHQLAAGLALFDERHKRRVRRDNRVPCLAREAVAVAGRAGLRIGRAAGRDDHAVRRPALPSCPNAGHAAVLHDKVAHARVNDAHARAPYPEEQRVDDVGSPVRHREHAVSALGLERDALFLKKRLHVRRRKRAERGIEKARIDRHVAQHLLRVAVVADVAASLSGYE